MPTNHSLWVLLPALQPWMTPLCFILAWGLVAYTTLTLGQFGRALWRQSQQMHRIPCAHCQFFTNDHRLKCPIHPLTAHSEQAIDCRDYLPLSR